MGLHGDETSIEVIATAEAARYLEEIAVEMTQLFGISLSEARGRINDQLGGQMFLTEIQVAVLEHEAQDVWAKHIYYGKNSFWWTKREDELSPIPYAPPVPERYPNVFETARPTFKALLESLSPRLRAVSSLELRASYQAEVLKDKNWDRVTFGLDGQSRGEHVEIAWAIVDKPTGQVLDSGYADDLEGNIETALGWDALPPPVNPTIE